MITLLTGAGIYILTALVSFLQKKVSSKISLRLVVALFTVIAGAVYYYMNLTNPDLIKQVITFVSGAFATSQAIWMVIDKFLPAKE